MEVLWLLFDVMETQAVGGLTASANAVSYTDYRNDYTVRGVCKLRAGILTLLTLLGYINEVAVLSTDIVGYDRVAKLHVRYHSVSHLC
jgi:hypothetical protein